MNVHLTSCDHIKLNNKYKEAARLRQLLTCRRLTARADICTSEPSTKLRQQCQCGASDVKPTRVQIVCVVLTCNVTDEMEETLPEFSPIFNVN